MNEWDENKKGKIEKGEVLSVAEIEAPDRKVNRSYRQKMEENSCCSLFIYSSPISCHRQEQLKIIVFVFLLNYFKTGTHGNCLV